MPLIPDAMRNRLLRVAPYIPWVLLRVSIATVSAKDFTSVSAIVAGVDIVPGTGTADV